MPEIIPIIIDEVSGRRLWQSLDCSTFLDVPSGVWTTYVKRQAAPQPVARLNARTPLWDADEVMTWADNRTRATKR